MRCKLKTCKSFYVCVFYSYNFEDKFVEKNMIYDKVRTKTTPREFEKNWGVLSLNVVAFFILLLIPKLNIEAVSDDSGILRNVRNLLALCHMKHVLYNFSWHLLICHWVIVTSQANLPWSQTSIH